MRVATARRLAFNVRTSYLEIQIVRNTYLPKVFGGEQDGGVCVLRASAAVAVASSAECADLERLIVHRRNLPA